MRKYLLAILACTALAGTVTPALGEVSHERMAVASNVHRVDGEVVVVDQAGSRIQLKHAAVPALKWPAMTMFFAVANQAQLAGLRAGDKVVVSFVPQPGSAPLIKQINRIK